MNSKLPHRYLAAFGLVHRKSQISCDLHSIGVLNRLDIVVARVPCCHQRAFLQVNHIFLVFSPHITTILPVRTPGPKEIASITNTTSRATDRISLQCLCTVLWEGAVSMTSFLTLRCSLEYPSQANSSSESFPAPSKDNQVTAH